MAKLPPPPWFDIKTGAPTEPFRAWAQALQNDSSTSSIVSGARIRATEIATAEAQAAADSAAAQAAAVAAAALAFSASVAPTSAQGLDSGSVTTNSVTVTPAGGTGPYTYAWTYVSGDTFTVNSPTAATTNFTTSVTSGQDKAAVYRCTVTDSLAATASCTVPVSASDNS